jgi:predicted enzyme related to lactoylglutathione lyase
VSPSLLLYVADMSRSVAFYSHILTKTPVGQSDNFAMFITDQGLSIRLWGRHDVQPSATPAGGSELAFSVETDDEVRTIRDKWVSYGVEIVQELTSMDFGYTFTAVDPDSHRLRVFKPS